MGSEATFAYEFPLSLVIKLSGALSGLEAQPNIERAHLKHVKTRGLETKCWETRENAQIRTSKATAGCPRRTGSQKIRSDAIFAYKFPLSLVMKLSGALSGLEAQPNIGRAHLKRVRTRGLKTKWPNIGRAHLKRVKTRGLETKCWEREKTRRSEPQRQ